MSRKRALRTSEKSALYVLVMEKVAQLNALPGATYADLQEMSTEDVLAYLEERGIQLDEEKLVAQVDARLGGYLAERERGVRFDAAKQAEFEKRIEAATRQQAVVLAKDSMGQFRQQAIEEADPRPSEERFYVWIAKLRRSCESCEELHGEVKSEAEWDDIGRPRSGNTLCGENCECDLVTVPATAEDTRRRIDAINIQTPRRQALLRRGG